MMTVKFPGNMKLSFTRVIMSLQGKKILWTSFCYTSFYYFNYKQIPIQMFFLIKIMEIFKINAVDDGRGDVCCQLPF